MQRFPSFLSENASVCVSTICSSMLLSDYFQSYVFTLGVEVLKKKKEDKSLQAQNEHNFAPGSGALVAP